MDLIKYTRRKFLESACFLTAILVSSAFFLPLPSTAMSGNGIAVWDGNKLKEELKQKISAKVNSSSAFFVKNGKAILLDDYYLFGHFREENNYLAVYSGTREEFPQFAQHYCTIGLLAERAIRDGDFHVSANLRPLLLDRDKDSVNIGTSYYDFELMLSIKVGTHYYDFELTKKTITYLGRMLDQVTFQQATNSYSVDLPADDNTPFVIDIIRTGQLITIKANGTIMYTCPVVSFTPGDIAIEVGNNFPDKPKSVLRLYDFQVTGFLAERSPEEEEWRQKVVIMMRQIRRNGNAFAYVEDDPALPRILIIGDSISFDYMDTVSATLNGKANVHRIPDNGKTTKYGLENLQKWLAKEKWDIIHFNFGLWDLTQTTPEDYQKNLEKIVQILKAAGGARLIWASTTPVPKEITVIPAGADIKYNAIAQQIMEKHNIPVNDLYSYVLPYIDEYKLYTGNIHFNMEGSAYLGKKVSTTLTDLMKGSFKN